MFAVRMTAALKKKTSFIVSSVLLICCYIRNHPQNSGLKQQSFIIVLSPGSGTWLGVAEWLSLGIAQVVAGVRWERLESSQSLAGLSGAELGRHKDLQLLRHLPGSQQTGNIIHGYSLKPLWSNIVAGLWNLLSFTPSGSLSWMEDDAVIGVVGKKCNEAPHRKSDLKVQRRGVDWDPNSHPCFEWQNFVVGSGLRNDQNQILFYWLTDAIEEYLHVSRSFLPLTQYFPNVHSGKRWEKQNFSLVNIISESLP